MPRRRLPSLSALRAFEAAARHQSFTKAAADLSVTQGAISHQVKSLEGELGLKLFVRQGKALLLTDAGRAYHDVVREAFDRLSAGTTHLLERENAGVLTVTMSPNFASKWLIHRLGSFALAEPGIQLRVSASMEHVDFSREDVDIAIRHGQGDWAGLHVTRLCSEELFPVCSPKLLEGRKPLIKPTDLRHHTLLHSRERNDWTQWLQAARMASQEPLRSIDFNQMSMALDAAVDGQGVAFARTALAAWDLIAGRLVCPFGPRLRVPFGYYIVCPKAKAERPKVATFRNWLLAEAARDARRLRSIL
jgi:LysR family glycine cleavage system transcriptional activator